jgi:hypothetical protein
MRKNYPYDEYFDIEEVIEEVEIGDFVVGQCYENTPARTLRDKKCGSTSFVVGQGSYYTAIKCQKCEYQVCIHDG